MCSRTAFTALVGKGVLFDSGGYHLKSAEAMEGMKFDMCGAANVLEAFEILVREETKENIMQCCLWRRMPSAQRPAGWGM